MYSMMWKPMRSCGSNGDDTFTLVKVLDEEGKAWLANEARNFPVAIDATLDKGIVQSLDDCDHSQGYAATMFFGGVGSPKTAECGQGLRFQNIPLSQGDTVTSAYL